MKTNVIDSCVCPNTGINEQNERLYDNPLWQPYPSSDYGFAVGSYVYAIQSGNDFYTRAIVISKTESDIYTIQFDNGVIQTETDVHNLLAYFPCNCGGTQDAISFQSGVFLKSSAMYGVDCIFTKEDLLNLVN